MFGKNNRRDIDGWFVGSLVVYVFIMMFYV